MRLDERIDNLTERDPSGCLLWKGARVHNGYGRIRVAGTNKLAHRAAYEAHVGPIPDGLTLDHLCRVRHCVEPAHLEPVPLRENVLRGVGPTAINAAKKKCKAGHPFDKVYSGARACSVCMRAKGRKWRRLNLEHARELSKLRKREERARKSGRPA